MYLIVYVYLMIAMCQIFTSIGPNNRMQHFCQYPQSRLRRTRKSSGVRRLVAETGLSVDDLIYPVFVLEDGKPSEPVPAMPGTSRTLGPS